MKLGLLASHRGSNAHAIVEACRAGRLQADPVLLISNNSRSGAMERARRAGVPVQHLSGATHPDPEALDEAIRDALVERGVELVVLAGYMKKLGPRTLERFSGRIVNTHPALLPRYGGRGMYGDRVHAAVLASGESETGVTIHLVDADYDTGPILARCRIPVRPDDSIETLAARVQDREREFYVETLASLVDGRLRLPARERPLDAPTTNARVRRG